MEKLIDDCDGYLKRNNLINLVPLGVIAIGWVGALSSSQDSGQSVIAIIPLGVLPRYICFCYTEIQEKIVKDTT